MSRNEFRTSKTTEQLDTEIADAVARVAASIEMHDDCPRDDHDWHARCLLRVLDNCRALRDAHEAKRLRVARHE